MIRMDRRAPWRASLAAFLFALTSNAAMAQHGDGGRLGDWCGPTPLKGGYMGGEYGPNGYRGGFYGPFGLGAFGPFGFRNGLGYYNSGNNRPDEVPYVPAYGYRYGDPRSHGHGPTSDFPEGYFFVPTSPVMGRP